MAGQPGSMCADGEWTPKQWNATFTANKMPLATFTAGLTRGVDYSGQINLLARGSAVGQDPPQGSIRIELTDSQLSQQIVRAGASVIRKSDSGLHHHHATLGLSGEMDWIRGRGTIRPLVAQRTRQLASHAGSRRDSRPTDQLGSSPCTY